jgi:hypothetical protein
MGFFSTATDTYFAFRFLRLLTTPWEKTGAYKLGIIDAEGKILRKPIDIAERSKYNIFHRLVFRIKRLLNKIPFGKTTVASYLAALWLIKEHTGISDKRIQSILHEVTGVDVDMNSLIESTWYVNEDSTLQAGVYTLARNIAFSSTGEELQIINTQVVVKENSIPAGSILGVPVYEVCHVKTKQPLFVTPHDLKR